VPGSVRTPSFEAYLAAGDRFDTYVKQLPLQRMVEPADVANLVAFLASDEAAAITGVAITIDSGLSVLMPEPTLG
jgi:NAD(P)-dependent dehydrogenase (short-subunit alcohol dehydrogenase family)